MKNPPDPQEERKRKRLTTIAISAVVGAVVAIGGAAFLMTIMEHKMEAKNPFYRVADLTDDTVDPAIWGKNFPLQYDGYKRTVDMVRTRYGGSEAMPRVPTEADPRSVTSQSLLEEYPDLKIMWAGYPFSKDYRARRGHAFMLEDQTYTARQGPKTPGTCLNCHASTYNIYKQEGHGDLMAGFAKVNQMNYTEARKLAKHPIACIDCHTSDTMELRVTRPAFMVGIKALKASQGVKDYDVNKMATRQEMRTYVCAQCHVEYYFNPKDKALVYPWAKGVQIENITSYYDDMKFKDFDHGMSGAPALKAQHPEFELWSQGIHARSGVSCADCHMPYKREGAMKISEHHVRSPMLSINRSCQTCHKWPEEELKARVENIQDRTNKMRGQAMAALVDLIKDIEAASASGRPDAELVQARDLQRKGQFALDFISSENSVGFHAPAEAMRVLGLSIDYCRQGQVALLKKGGLPVKKAEATTH